jgi:hypothetical protein
MNGIFTGGFAARAGSTSERPVIRLVVEFRNRIVAGGEIRNAPMSLFWCRTLQVGLCDFLCQLAVSIREFGIRTNFDDFCRNSAFGRLLANKRNQTKILNRYAEQRRDDVSYQIRRDILSSNTGRVETTFDMKIDDM